MSNYKIRNALPIRIECSHRFSKISVYGGVRQIDHGTGVVRDYPWENRVLPNHTRTST